MYGFICLIVESFSTSENFEKYAGDVTLSGLIIVFSMLVLLVFFIAVFGMIMQKTGKSKKADKSSKKTEKPAKPAPVVQKQVISDVSDDGDVMAVISASVMMMYENTGIKPVIRSVKPAQKGSRSAWQAAGIAFNTRPF